MLSDHCIMHRHRRKASHCVVNYLEGFCDISHIAREKLPEDSERHVASIFNVGECTKQEICGGCDTLSSEMEQLSVHRRIVGPSTERIPV
jgi:hypothetical protein